MVFTGIPVFLDPPNWQQDQQGGGRGSAAARSGGGGSVLVGGIGGSSAADNPPVPMLQRPHSEMVPTTVGGASSGSSTRPTLMAERARLAKVQPPDLSLKCPRCESTNTKFCYYNNYSLSQPRHFCKTCRRYWTKGGALRNVPVGGGCRRNKRSKNSSNNNNSNTNRSRAIETSSATSSGGATIISSGNCTGEIIGIDNHPPPPSMLPFLSTIHGFSDYSNGGTGIGLAFPSRDFLSTGAGNSLGLDFMAPNEQAENSSLGHWRMQQHFPAPFSRPEGLVHIEPQLLLPFDGEGLVEHQYLGTGASDQLRGKPPSHLGNSGASIKMEDNQSQNLAYWNGNGWGDFQDFPSTTTSLL